MGSTAWARVRDRSSKATGPRWLSWAYSTIGVHFEDIYCWEALPVSSNDFYAGADLDEVGKLHFMNWPVSSTKNNDKNPWSLLKRVASPSDFVVIKLDIDTPAVESELVEQLLADTDLLALVDVFFFEHHVFHNGFKWLWSDMLPETPSESYKIFVALRKLGIQAHSWP